MRLPTLTDGSYYTNSYRENWRDGEYISVDVSEDGLVQVEGVVYVSPAEDYYNYVVMRVTNEVYWTPFVSGQRFSMSAQADMELLKSVTAEGYTDEDFWGDGVLPMMGSQNYTPGERSFGGIGYRDAYLSLAADDTGCHIIVKPH